MVCGISASPAFAQLALRADLPHVQRVALTTTHGELHGIVRDNRGQPLRGAVVSALGATTAFAVSDREGRYAFRDLPAGPYLVRAHLQGYLRERGHIVQVNANAQASWAIALTRTEPSKEPVVLAAGIGPVETVSAPPDSSGDDAEDEAAWRLRHAKRSVLKEAEAGAVNEARASATPVSLFSDINGEVNFLTSTAFVRPQDLFSASADVPRGIAYLSLVAPTAAGEWKMRGTITEGDLSSWMLAGAYVRRGPVAHRYEAGYSYAMQRYEGGNLEVLNSLRAGNRNVGELYAYDNWAVNPRLSVRYGAKYADYAYLNSPRLLSPRVNVNVKPFDDDLTVRATVAHRETAPGAEEFVPPEVGPWLPPQRTFSTISGGAFRPERLEHVELAAERPIAGGVVVGMRAFEQRVSDQMVTVFGVPMADAPATLGHYHVGAAGDFDASGWGASVSRSVGPVHATVEYSEIEARWLSQTDDVAAVAQMAATLPRGAARIHDLTSSVDTVVPVTATRIFVLYKVNSAMAGADSGFRAASRFNVQVNQALPFLNFSGTRVEMIVAMRNMFHDDPFDGSVYDELLVVHPPKQMVGGVTVRF
jgi:hypothetical protein